MSSFDDAIEMFHCTLYIHIVVFYIAVFVCSNYLHYSIFHLLSILLINIAVHKQISVSHSIYILQDLRITNAFLIMSSRANFQSKFIKIILLLQIISILSYIRKYCKMSPKRRSCLSRSTSAAYRMVTSQAVETLEQR